jgi:sigma-54 dependent transcriptional regulator, acetoin dehydrogenase operon transcriptional activator AcoR
MKSEGTPEYGNVEPEFPKWLLPHTVAGDSGFRMILENMADGVVALDRDLRISYFNRAASEITGFSRAEVIGRYCRDVFQTCHFTDRCFLRESMETGKSFMNLESCILNKNDQKVLVSVSAAPYRDAMGEVVGGIQVFRKNSAPGDLSEEPLEGYSFHGIVSEHRSFREIFRVLPLIAESDLTSTLHKRLKNDGGELRLPL